MSGDNADYLDPTNKSFKASLRRFFYLNLPWFEYAFWQLPDEMAEGWKEIADNNPAITELDTPLAYAERKAKRQQFAINTVTLVAAILSFAGLTAFTIFFFVSNPFGWGALAALVATAATFAIPYIARKAVEWGIKLYNKIKSMPNFATHKRLFDKEQLISDIQKKITLTDNQETQLRQNLSNIDATKPSAILSGNELDEICNIDGLDPNNKRKLRKILGFSYEEMLKLREAEGLPLIEPRTWREKLADWFGFNSLSWLSWSSGATDPRQDQRIGIHKRTSNREILGAIIGFFTGGLFAGAMAFFITPVGGTALQIVITIVASIIGGFFGAKVGEGFIENSEVDPEHYFSALGDETPNHPSRWWFKRAMRYLIFIPTYSAFKIFEVISDAALNAMASVTAAYSAAGVASVVSMMITGRKSKNTTNASDYLAATIARQNDDREITKTFRFKLSLTSKFSSDRTAVKDSITELQYRQVKGLILKNAVKINTLALSSIRDSLPSYKNAIRQVLINNIKMIKLVVDKNSLKQFVSRIAYRSHYDVFFKDKFLKNFFNTDEGLSIVISLYSIHLRKNSLDDTEYNNKIKKFEHYKNKPNFFNDLRKAVSTHFISFQPVVTPPRTPGLQDSPKGVNSFSSNAADYPLAVSQAASSASLAGSPVVYVSYRDEDIAERKRLEEENKLQAEYDQFLNEFPTFFKSYVLEQISNNGIQQEPLFADFYFSAMQECWPEFGLLFNELSRLIQQKPDADASEYQNMINIFLSEYNATNPYELKEGEWSDDDVNTMLNTFQKYKQKQEDKLITKSPFAAVADQLFYNFRFPFIKTLNLYKIKFEHPVAKILSNIFLNRFCTSIYACLAFVGVGVSKTTFDILATLPITHRIMSGLEFVATSVVRFLFSPRIALKDLGTSIRSLRTLTWSQCMNNIGNFILESLSFAPNSAFDYKAKYQQKLDLANEGIRQFSEYQVRRADPNRNSNDDRNNDVDTYIKQPLATILKKKNDKLKNPVPHTAAPKPQSFIEAIQQYMEPVYSKKQPRPTKQKDLPLPASLLKAPKSQQVPDPAPSSTPSGQSRARAVSYASIATSTSQRSVLAAIPHHLQTAQLNADPHANSAPPSPVRAPLSGNAPGALPRSPSTASLA